MLEPKDIKEIKTLIDLMKKNELTVLEIEKEGSRINIERGSSGQTPAAGPLPTAVAPKAASKLVLKLRLPYPSRSKAFNSGKSFHPWWARFIALDRQMPRPLLMLGKRLLRKQ